MQYLSECLLATKTGRPRGEKQTQRKAVAAQQRERLLLATAQLMVERGCTGTTIERIAKAAGVSSITFYDHFASKEEALVAAFERAVEEGRERLAREVPSDLPWPEQVREGLRVLLATIAARPEWGRVCFTCSSPWRPEASWRPAIAPPCATSASSCAPRPRPPRLPGRS